MSDKVQLGQEALYPYIYDSALLQSIPRTAARKPPSCAVNMPFSGCDLWNAYELSWLNPQGRPEVAIAQFCFCASSEYIVESKSFKYYLNSLNGSSFGSRDALGKVLMRDLTAVSRGDVSVTFYDVAAFDVVHVVPGLCVDDLDVSIDQYTPDAGLLSVGDECVERERLYSHLLKSNCPVTGQPDWATIWIEYSGKKIDPESFLRYVVSFRNHQGFHESCVEKIFVDLQERCSPSQLSVYARYTRRGGLDINPFRTNCAREVPFGRLARQ